MIEKKKKTCIKLKPKLITTVREQFVPWYYKAFNKKINFTKVVERGIVQYIWETTTNIIKAQSLYRYDPDGSPYWYWAKPEQDVLDEAKKLAKFAFYSLQSKPKHFYTSDEYYKQRRLIELDYWDRIEQLNKEWEEKLLQEEEEQKKQQ